MENLDKIVLFDISCKNKETHNREWDKVSFLDENRFDEISLNNGEINCEIWLLLLHLSDYRKDNKVLNDCINKSKQVIVYTGGKQSSKRLSKNEKIFHIYNVDVNSSKDKLDGFFKEYVKKLVECKGELSPYEYYGDFETEKEYGCIISNLIYLALISDDGMCEDYWEPVGKEIYEKNKQKYFAKDNIKIIKTAINASVNQKEDKLDSLLSKNASMPMWIKSLINKINKLEG